MWHVKPYPLQRESLIRSMQQFSTPHGHTITGQHHQHSSSPLENEMDSTKFTLHPTLSSITPPSKRKRDKHINRGHIERMKLQQE